MSDIGVDDNVFNEAEDPKRDTLATFTPALGFKFNAGPTVMTGRVGGQYVYFAKYASERSWGSINELRADLPSGRWTPFVTGSYGETKNRIGFEIDGRVRQKAIMYGGGALIDFSGRTNLTAQVRRLQTDFDESELFRGVQLAAPLNRTSDELGLEFRYGLTPLTTVVGAVYGGNDRFDIDKTRNTDYYRTMGGLEFKPFALISGSVLVGVLRASAKDAQIPDAQTFTTSADLTYHVGGTSASVRVTRDRSYSFESTDPYYFLTDATVSLTQRVGGPWDVVVRGERGSLAYQSIESVGNVESQAGVDGRTDDLRGYGAGVGYRIGRNLRFGVDWQRMERKSARAGASFRRTRIGGSFAYELGQ